MFIAELFIIAQVWKQHKCLSVVEWIKKLWYIYTMEYHVAVKKKGTLAFCDSMDRPGEYYANRNKPVRERQIPHDPTHMWNLIKN